VSAELVRRIWARDPSVWSSQPAGHREIAQRLGWLTLPEDMAPAADRLTSLAEDIRKTFRRVVLMGMGGSSLAPEVLWRAFGARPDWPTFQLMDSTDPDAVHAATAAASPAESLFIVASKSGGTVETDALFRHFWKLAPRGEQFVAITDPDTPLAALAAEHRFRHLFLNPPDVGGRYSALSYFGLVPAALIGIDVARLLERAREMAGACAPSSALDRNPGYRLGDLLGRGASQLQRDKATLWMGPEIRGFGLWAEQLVAESTGKDGRGVLPVVDEPVGPPEAYRDDRVFLLSALEGGGEAADSATVRALVERRAPMEQVTLRDRYDLGAEFFRWEFGTAVAGAILGVDPFDQPNVAESKRNTAEILKQLETRGARFETPAALTKDSIRRWIDAAASAGYVALLAYAPPTPENDRHLAELRRRLRDRLRVATTAGYGPRYLHSTGQYHKGGPQTGAFVLITVEHQHDLDVPGKGYTFGALQEAQALGDWEALHRRNRPVLRLHLSQRGADLGEAVERITA